ncbi:MAG: hypothetical protein NVSMB27_29230 [Ktedonobacteraceae bacterium]
MDVKYRAHVQNIGWQDWVTNGQVAGTTGQSLRMEAIQIQLDGVPPGVGVRYRAHVQNIGWQDWVTNGQVAGTTGQSLRMEAIMIELTGIAPNNTFRIAYEAHVQNIGWQEFVQNGGIAGTTGQSLRMEAIRIVLVPALQDLSPDPANVDQATLNVLGSISTSGRMLGLAGNQALLYAFSQNAGVWKSASGGVWVQALGSPRPAQQQGPNIAVDPQNTSHVVAGNDSGAWESMDAGASWGTTPVFQPVSVGCGSNQISAITFDANSQLFLGVDCGIVLRQALGQPFTLTTLPQVFGQNIGPVTAFAVSQTKIWARTSNALLVSTTNGSTWSAPGIVPNTIQFRQREVFTLAAFDRFAFMVAGAPDPVSPGSTDNTLIIYDSNNGAWEVQNVTFLGKNTADGTGAGNNDGRKFVKSFILNTPNVPMVVGQGLQLFYCAGQEIYQAASLDLRNGTIPSWNWIVGTQGAGFTDRDPVHADIWDFLIDVSVGGNTAWIAGDGGIYKFVTTFPFNFPQGGWKTQLLGLHTHQIHTLTVLNTSPDSRSRLAYPTSDNDAWVRDTSPIVMPEAPWQARGDLGDANYTVGDPSCADFVILARNRETVVFYRYGSVPQNVVLLNYKKDVSSIGPDSPTQFQFIPSPKSSGRFNTVDAVMLVDLPLTFVQNGVNVPFFPPSNPLGRSSNGAPMLIRNKNFDADPNMQRSKGSGWAVEVASFPAGALGFYVTGNRTKPIYYSFTQNTLSSFDGSQWNLVATNLVSSATFGPAFINPWDKNVLYILTNNGIQVSTNGGMNFTPEATLTSLVAGAGKFPMSTVSQIAFNYDNPSEQVCGAQSGVFYSTGNGTWTDLTALLPLPLTPVMAVGIDNEGVYVATDGRSLLRISMQENT